MTCNNEDSEAAATAAKTSDNSWKVTKTPIKIDHRNYPMLVYKVQNLKKAKKNKKWWRTHARIWNDQKCKKSSETNFKHIPRTRKLKKLAGVGEDNNSNLGIAENGQFLSLLEQPSASFRECDLPAVCIFNPLDLNLPPTHVF